MAFARFSSPSEAGQHERDEPRAQDPERGERDVPERPKPEARAQSRLVGDRLGSKAIEADLHRDVGAKKRRQRGTENQPRDPADDRGDPAVLEERRHAERAPMASVPTSGAATLVRRPGVLAHLAGETLLSPSAEGQQATTRLSRPAGRSQLPGLDSNQQPFG